MTDDPLDLDAIEDRADAATDGPWYPWNRGVGWHIALEQPAGDSVPACIPEGSRTDIGRGADATFIAAAREDVPALVAEARRLRARVAELEEELEGVRTEALRIQDEDIKILAYATLRNEHAAVAGAAVERVRALEPRGEHHYGEGYADALGDVEDALDAAGTPAKPGAEGPSGDTTRGGAG